MPLPPLRALSNNYSERESAGQDTSVTGRLRLELLYKKCGWQLCGGACPCYFSVQDIGFFCV